LCGCHINYNNRYSSNNTVDRSLCYRSIYLTLDAAAAAAAAVDADVVDAINLVVVVAAAAAVAVD
jgi:hypothetical protein